MQTSVFGVVCITFQRSILYITLKIELKSVFSYLMVIICSVVYWYYMVSHTYLTKQSSTSVWKNLLS